MNNTPGSTFRSLHSFLNDVLSGKLHEDFFDNHLNYEPGRIICFDQAKQLLIITDWESYPVFDSDGNFLEYQDKSIERIIKYKDHLISSINKAYRNDYKYLRTVVDRLTTDQSSLRSYIQDVDRQLKNLIDELDSCEPLTSYNITGAPLLNMLHKIYNEFADYFEPNTNPDLQAFPFHLNSPEGVSLKVFAHRLKSALVDEKLIDRNTSTQQFEAAFSGSDKVFFPSKIKWLPQTHNKQSPNFKALHYLIAQLDKNNFLKQFPKHRQTKMLESIFCRPDGSPLNLHRNSKHDLKRSPRKETAKFHRNALFNAIDRVIEVIRL